LYISVLVVAILVGWVGIQGVLRRKEKSDPSEIVVDEVIGCGIAFAPCAFQGVFEGALGSLGNSQGSLVWAVATLGIFRVLDIWKPWPIRPLESIPGPLGIILDDGVAGLMTVLVVAVLRIPLAIAP
jgi:phosphatidylglycerophosphatase A